METLKPYTDGENMNGAMVLTWALEEYEILGENNFNQPSENSVLGGQKNKDDNMYECVVSLNLSMMEIFVFIRD